MPLSAIIVGAGHRGMAYGSYALSHPDELQIVGVADPCERRRQRAAKAFGLKPEQCFESAAALAAQPKCADFVMNCTMDHQHIETSLPLLARGYHMLLEKPFACNEEEARQLLEAARCGDRKIAICHVLRYAPFYVEVHKRVMAGEIGDLINVQAAEHVAYHHMVVAYVRGKWNRRDYCQSTMLMAKCCHDLDLILWLKRGVRPRRVSSFASNFQFRREKAPPNAGTRCIVDCPIESECQYSARKHYLDNPKRWAFYVWTELEDVAEPSEEQRLELMRTGPFGRCVWKTDMDVVDHQSVAIDFEDGSTATLNMVGGAAEASRTLHLIGTKGEIRGNLEDGQFVIRRIAPGPGQEFTEELVDLKDCDIYDGHGGGDHRLVTDFLAYLRDDVISPSTTTLEDSMLGHLLGFRANLAQETGQIVDIPAV